MLPEQELLELIAHKLRFLEQKPLVAFLGSLQPLNWVPPQDVHALLTTLGAPLAPQAARFPAQAEVVLVFLEGVGLSEGVALLPQLALLPGLDSTLAVQKSQVYVLNYEWFQQAASVSKLECLAEMLYPRLFSFGHQGSAWLNLAI